MRSRRPAPVTVTVTLPADLAHMAEAAAEMRQMPVSELITSMLDVTARCDLWGVLRGEVPAGVLLTREFLMRTVAVLIAAQAEPARDPSGGDHD
ncbi:hypothetical protein [Rhodovulum sp. PH10]|uniref:hypothetical protein n=1 Tax=Rhodovulum sp. PH10 TaxID=1187851 RepID=UPI0012F8EFC0|nr:hypothetical protein [Rhodovulum sp. PH10]